jgi:hypothetical protein
MGRWSSIVAAAAATAAAALLSAGCASSSRTGGPPATPSGSGAGSATAGPGSGPGSATGAPAQSSSPTGPAATAAIGTPPPLGTHAVARLAGTTVNCPDDPYGGSERQQAPQPLVGGVHVKAVVRCETVQRTYAGLGEWSVQLAEAADTGFDPFLTELRKPSQPAASGVSCPAIAYLMPWFVLIRDDGTLLRVAVPTTQCGQPSPAAMAALNRLDFRAVDAVRVQQTRSPESISSGCDQAFKDVVAIEATEPAHAHATQGTSVGDLASPPTSVLVCLYKAGPLEGGMRAGDLIKGATVTNDAAAQLAGEAAVVAALPATCADADTFAVLRTSNGRFGSVELGGCHRLLTNDGRLGTASAQLITTLTTLLGVS